MVYLCVCRSTAKLRSLLAQIGASAVDLAKMFNNSELTIQEHCDSIRLQVDIAREIAIENIHKASKALMTEIDTYERDCLSSWAAAKESAEATVENVSKRMSAFVTEKQKCLRSLEGSDDELILQLELHEAKKLAQELGERNKELKAAMFDNKLASFNAFSSIGESSLGELTFAHIQLPFKKLDIASTELKPIDIRAHYDFLLPLDQGKRVVLFNRYLKSEDFEKSFTQMSCFDRFGRLLGINSVEHHVKSDNVAQCGPREFAVCHYWYSPELSVYNSKLKCLRTVGCKYFSQICRNSAFLFGLWDTGETSDENDPYINNQEADSDDDDDDIVEEKHSRRRIQVHHLDTLSGAAFSLRVPEKYTIEKIMADEHHVVAMSSVGSEWFMSIFDLDGKTNCGQKAARFFLAERHIELSLKSLWMPVFMYNEWLVVPHKKELAWFDKKGKRCETSTQLDNSNVEIIYSSGSSLLFGLLNQKLLLKQ